MFQINMYPGGQGNSQNPQVQATSVINTSLPFQLPPEDIFRAQSMNDQHHTQCSTLQNRCNYNCECKRNNQKFELNRAKRHYNVDPRTVNSNETLKNIQTYWRDFFRKLSLTYFAQNFFGKWIVTFKVKVSCFPKRHYHQVIIYAWL